MDWKIARRPVLFSFSQVPRCRTCPRAVNKKEFLSRFGYGRISQWSIFHPAVAITVIYACLDWNGTIFICPNWRHWKSRMPADRDEIIASSIYQRIDAKRSHLTRQALIIRDMKIDLSFYRLIQSKLRYFYPPAKQMIPHHQLVFISIYTKDCGLSSSVCIQQVVQHQCWHVWCGIYCILLFRTYTERHFMCWRLYLPRIAYGCCHKHMRHKHIQTAVKGWTDFLSYEKH